LDKDLIDCLNVALDEISSSEFPLVLLPELETSSTVVTGTDPYVALPSNFHRHLYCVKSAAHEKAEIAILGSTKRLQEEYGVELDTSGDVKCVTLKGSNLYYQPIPSEADTLTLYYYRIPTYFTDDDTGNITVIPANFQIDTLVNNVLSQLYEMKGDYAKADRYRVKYELGLKRLSEAIPFKSKQYISRGRAIIDF